MKEIKKVLEREELSRISVKHTVLFYEKLSNEYNKTKYQKNKENINDEDDKDYVF